MYDELIKRLRNRRICIQQSGSLDDFPLLQEAADAIEELSVIVRAQKAVLDKFPKWIPVTERLPKDDVHYVLCCGAKGGMFVGWVAVRSYDGGDKATAFVHGGNGRNITHWMPLPESPKEET